MAKNVNNTESNNQVINFNNGQQYLINRMNKILEHPIMCELLVEEFQKMLSQWSITKTEREIARIDAEIAKLQEKKNSIQNK